MTKEEKVKNGFIFLLGFQTFMTIVAVLVIVLGGVELGVGEIPILGSLLAGTVAGLVMYGTIFLALRLNRFSRFNENLSKNVRNVHLSWPQIILISIFAGVAEELLFRGAIQSLLASHTNIYIGVLVASVLFGLVHFSSFAYFVLTMAIGVSMGVAYYLSKSIEFVIVWHIVADIVALGIFVKHPEYLGGSVEAT